MKGEALSELDLFLFVCLFVDDFSVIRLKIKDIFLEVLRIRYI